jgi:endoglucanase
VVDFINDAYGGVSTEDRNLYVNSVTYDGTTTAVNKELLSNGGISPVTVAAAATITAGAVIPGPTTTTTVPTKPSTADTLVLNMAEDAWLGDAEFSVTVDGVQIGGVQTVTALHGSGASQDFTIHGDFGTGAHVVVVTFLNDAYGGSPSTDRNLYLNSINFDGSVTTLNTNVGPVATNTVTAASPPAAQDTLVVNVSEDAWQGNAEFVVLVDGTQVGGTQTATALHASGQTQNVTLTGNFGPGQHSVVVDFINDAYGGVSTEDRNLYVNSVTYDGTTTAVNTPLFSNGGTKPIIVSDVATISAGAVNSGQDMIVLQMAEDAWQGNAQFTLTVDGKQVGVVQTVTASNAAGAQQQFVFYGNFGAGTHDVAVNFLNAASGGTASTERNLYVKSITYDGVAQPNSSDAIDTTGAANFAVSTTPTASGPDTLTMYVSENAYAGDAQFSVTVDGKFVGIGTATGNNATGGTEPVTMTGNFGSGPHTVQVTFLNDAYAGAGEDRNLYLSGIDYNGVYTPINAALGNTGSSSTITVNNGGTAAKPLADMSPPGTLQYVGINLSGLEFGAGNYPGVLNTDYVMPTHAEIDSYAAEGMNIIRLPFAWERLQPVMNGPLDQNYLSLIDNVVNYAASKGMTVDLDLHNYGLYYGNPVGGASVPNSAFANLWSQVAQHYASTPNVMFDLMNEPYEQTGQQWVQSANAAIAAIRGTGASQEILVGGVNYENGEAWTTSSDVFMSGIVDPKMNFAYEVHQYINVWNGPITSVVSPTFGADSLQAVTQWAQANGARLFLGEFGAVNSVASLAATTNELNYIAQNTNVWQGATEWGGGPWWGNYAYSTEPVNGSPSPQVQMLQHYLTH